MTSTSNDFQRAVGHGLGRYYAKLTSAAYCHPSFIQHPPAGGWTDDQLDVDALRTNLGRSDLVVDLLRHVPYVKPRHMHMDIWPVYPKSRPVRYLRDRGTWAQTRDELAALPAHVVSLTHGTSTGTATDNDDGVGLYGPYWWLVDCKERRIVMYSGPERGAAFGLGWRPAQSQSFDDPAIFFGDLVMDLVNLVNPPVPPVDGVAADLWSCDYAEAERAAVKNEYSFCGWFAGHDNVQFRRDSCRARLKNLMRKKAAWERKLPEMEEKRLLTRNKLDELGLLFPSRANTNSNNNDNSAVYDRSAIVAAITYYYQRLSKMAYFPAHAIDYPPPGGWPDGDFLPADKIQMLGFNDRVVDLLRHIPYVLATDGGPDAGWAVWSGPAYPHVYLQGDAIWDTLDPERENLSLCAEQIFPWDNMADGLVPLTRGEYAEWWILDTNTGNMTLYDSGGHKNYVGPAVAFFQTISNKLLELELVPVPPPGYEWAMEETDIWGGFSDHWKDNNELWDLSIEEVRDVYRSRGWPNVENFKSKACYEALIELRDRLLDEEPDGSTPDDSEEEVDNEWH